MCELVIYDRAGVRVGLLQDYSTVQWVEHFQAVGEVKVSARLTQANLALLKPGRQLYNPDTGTAALIVQVETLEDADRRELTVRGVGTAWLLGQRIVMGCERVSEAESGMYGIAERNQRGLPIGVGAAVGPACPVEAELAWCTVLQAMEKLAIAGSLGFRVDFDPETAAQTLRVTRGVDRSVPGADYVGYFGADMGNLSNLRVTRNEAESKNVAIVGGEESEGGRSVRVTSGAGGPVGEGDRRRELFVDARDLRRKAQVASPTGTVDSWGNPVYSYRQVTYTEEEYATLLDGRGLDALAGRRARFEVRCDAQQSGLEYGRDYGLGDRMPLRLGWESGAGDSEGSADNGLGGGENGSVVVTVRSVKLVYEPTGRRVLASLEGG